MQRQIIGYTRINPCTPSSLEHQVAQLKIAGAVAVITDIGSGASKNRAGYHCLITMIQAAQVEAVVVTRLDRVSRSSTELWQFLDICQSQNVEVRVLEQFLSWTQSEAKLRELLAECEGNLSR